MPRPLNKQELLAESREEYHALEKFLEKNAEKIKSDPDASIRYKLTMKDDQLGNTIFLFQKTGWENAMKLIKRGNVSVAITF